MGGFADEEFAANHLLDEALRRGGGDGLGGDVAAVAQDGDGVAELENFLEAVGDVDNGEAAGLEGADEAEEFARFAEGEGTGRFVHDDDARAGADGRGDLDKLLAAGREGAEEGGGVEIGADFGEEGAGAGVEGAAVDPAEAVAREVAEAEVFGDGEVGAEGEFLVHHRDAEGASGARRGGADYFPVEEEVAGVRLVNAGEDFTEGAFARAVFADEGVARAAFNGDADAVQREDAGEASGDVAELEEGHGREFIN